MSLFAKLKSMLANFFGTTGNIILLNVLHIFNDGAKIGLIILLPFIAKELHINLTQVGFLGAILNMCLILFSVPAGFVAARIGGVKTLFIALCLYSFGYIASGFVFSYLLLLATFFIAGMGFGVFHPICLILLTKWVDKKIRGREMGNFSALGDFGTVGLPALLVFTVSLVGWRISITLYGILFLVFFWALYFRFTDKKEKQEEQKKHIHVSFITYLQQPQFLLAVLAGSLDGFASASLFIFLPFLLLQKGFPEATLGIFAALFFIGSFVGKATLGRGIDRFGNVSIFVFSELCMAVFIILLTHTTIIPILIIASIIVGGFTRGTAPVAATMISDVVDQAGNAEKAFGVNGIVMGVATSIAPVILGFISDKFGIVMAFNTMAAVAVCATLPALLIRRSQAKVLINQRLQSED